MLVLEKEIRNFDRVSFLIGNGPNLFSQILPTWKELLFSVADHPFNFEITGLSNTEVYDLVELNSKEPTKIKDRVADNLKLSNTSNLAVHQRLMDFCHNNSIPVLTTNFDEAFEQSVRAIQFHIDSKGFTRFYPWKTYYGYVQHTFPTDGFGIWKIHGDLKYKDSIRLGLTDYMGSVERARRLIHNEDDRSFKGKNQDYWPGYQTWLHIWFNLPIFIFGINLGVDEVFLRWLLIERKRYKNSHSEPMEVVYISKDLIQDVGNFMQNLGIEIIQIKDYQEIYGCGYE